MCHLQKLQAHKSQVVLIPDHVLGDGSAGRLWGRSSQLGCRGMPWHSTVLPAYCWRVQNVEYCAGWYCRSPIHTSQGTFTQRVQQQLTPCVQSAQQISPHLGPTGFTQCPEDGGPEKVDKDHWPHLQHHADLLIHFQHASQHCISDTAPLQVHTMPDSSLVTYAT